MILLGDRGSFTNEVIFGLMRGSYDYSLLTLVDFIAARKIYRRMYLSILPVKANWIYNASIVARVSRQASSLHVWRVLKSSLSGTHRHPWSRSFDRRSGRSVNNLGIKNSSIVHIYLGYKKIPKTVLKAGASIKSSYGVRIHTLLKHNKLLTLTCTILAIRRIYHVTHIFFCTPPLYRRGLLRASKRPFDFVSHDARYKTSVYMWFNNASVLVFLSPILRDYE